MPPKSRGSRGILPLPWCSGSRSTYLGDGSREKIREEAAVKVKTKVILEWKRCDRKGRWGDLNGDYANAPFIVVCFAGKFYGIFLRYHMLFNAAISLSLFIEHLNMPASLNS